MPVEEKVHLDRRGIDLSSLDPVEAGVFKLLERILIPKGLDVLVRHVLEPAEGRSSTVRRAQAISVTQHYPTGGNPSVTVPDNLMDCCWIDRRCVSALHRTRKRPDGLYRDYHFGSCGVVLGGIHQQSDLAPGKRKLLSPCRHSSLAGWSGNPRSYLAKA